MMYHFFGEDSSYPGAGGTASTSASSVAGSGPGAASAAASGTSIGSASASTGPSMDSADSTDSANAAETSPAGSAVADSSGSSSKWTFSSDSICATSQKTSALRLRPAPGNSPPQRSTWQRQTRRKLPPRWCLPPACDSARSRGASQASSRSRNPSDRK